jgi:hypothetical protein
MLRRAARLRLDEGQWKQKVSKAGTRVYLEYTVLLALVLVTCHQACMIRIILLIRNAFGAAHRH